MRATTTYIISIFTSATSTIQSILLLNENTCFYFSVWSFVHFFGEEFSACLSVPFEHHLPLFIYFIGNGEITPNITTKVS